MRDEDGQEHYFVRGVILLPLRGRDDAFGIGAWVSQPKRNFGRCLADEPMEPTAGWLSNRIAHYEPSTFLLKARLHFGDGTSAR